MAENTTNTTDTLPPAALPPTTLPPTAWPDDILPLTTVQTTHFPTTNPLSDTSQVGKSESEQQSSRSPNDGIRHMSRSCMGFLRRFRSRSTVPTWVVVSVVVLTLVTVVGIIIGWELRPKAIGEPPLSQFPGRIIAVEMTILGEDPLLNGGTVDVAFSPGWDSCNPYNNLTDCPIVDIYMDRNLFAGATDPDTTESDGTPKVPVFQYNSTLAPTASLPVFEATLTLTSRNASKLDVSLINYPFDQYTAEIFMFAQEESTNNFVGIVISLPRGSAAVGFYTFIDTSETGSDNASNDVSNVFGVADVYLAIRRATPVKLYVIVIIIALWLITLLLLAITIKAVFFHYEVDVAVLVVPVATVFAFTTLRTSMPGSPTSFGAIIDFVGTLPAFAILVLLTALCLVHVLITSRKRIGYDQRVSRKRKVDEEVCENESEEEPSIMKADSSAVRRADEIVEHEVSQLAKRATTWQAGTGVGSSRTLLATQKRRGETV